ncbi:SNF1-related protein kinase regulatory subunit gamma-1-like [Juglans microcarpa x Juglans regia]|uniref:SNF1-related protein kinase regulatory subunit gamma-1-like n=1 Tax=Juglans microcarpa x Juglans regia TaxID=2249226 RepID=UPI001B7F6A43|nr:SNF1-related protein kinase regulatory subunit gamma-1-like [Juglans microcarpa x Juglans regia]
MDSRQMESVMKDSESGMLEMKEVLISNLNSGHKKQQLDSGTSLQLFLDRIPISSIPGINNSSVLELKTGDTVGDAIQMLYEKDVFGVPIADILDLDPDDDRRRFSDRYIGFIDFASMFLWCLENPDIGQTKVGELAKSFLWNPFFPVHLDETLFRVLLLLSKHPLQVVPVIDRTNSNVTGFVTQNAVIQLLLQSSGLEWFDSIANKPLSEFRFENEEHVVHVYGDQSIAEALHVLWGSRIGVVAVLNRETNRLIGSIRSSDIYLLVENETFLHDRKNLTIEEFIHVETGNKGSDPTIEWDLGALFSAGILRLKNNFLPRMDSPVTNKKTDTLMQVMKNMAETKSTFSFLVNDFQQAKGVFTPRDVIVQFAPPCIDSTIHGVGFFESALDQTRCHVKDGTLVCNQ